MTEVTSNLVDVNGIKYTIEVWKSSTGDEFRYRVLEVGTVSAAYRSHEKAYECAIKEIKRRHASYK